MNREYDILYSTKTLWDLRTKGNKKKITQISSNLSRLEDFRDAVESLNSAERRVVSAVGTTLGVAALTAMLTGDTSAAIAMIDGLTVAFDAINDVSRYCRDADYYYNKL